MRKLAMQKRYVVSFVLSLALSQAVTMITAQETTIIRSFKSGDLTIRFSDLPISPEIESGSSIRFGSGDVQVKAVPLRELTGAVRDQNEPFFCSTQDYWPRRRNELVPKAVGAVSCGITRNQPCYWNNPFIFVGFINGTPELKQAVKEVAAEWTRWANLVFIFRDNTEYDGDKADIKISFNDRKDHSSSIGINSWAARESKDEPTMKLGFLNRRIRDQNGNLYQWVEGIILHEFGHALGLHHEHQNPVGGILWNREAVIADLSKPPDPWTPEKIEWNVFRALQSARTQFTQYDPSSIMHYSFPAHWTLNNISVPGNDALSETDKRFVAQAYPRKKVAVRTDRYYRLTTWYKNNTHCLGIARSTDNTVRQYFPYLNQCDDKSNGQLWKFTSIGNGDYRITNYLTGNELSLSDVGVEYYAEMRASGNHGGQHWSITSLGKYHRLTNKLSGSLYSFTSATRLDSRLYMHKTGHWANQLWEFVPVIR